MFNQLDPAMSSALRHIPASARIVSNRMLELEEFHISLLNSIQIFTPFD